MVKGSSGVEGFLPYEIIKREAIDFELAAHPDVKFYFDAHQTGGIPDDCPLPLDEA